MNRSLPPPDWLVLTIEAPPSGEEILMLEALRRSGAYAVEREGDGVVGLFPPDPEPDRVVRRVYAAIRASTSLREPRVTWHRRPEDEWKATWPPLGARRVGRRFVVAPTGSEAEFGEGDVVIRLVPGVAFGSAEHATTRRCLRCLEDLVRPDHRIADVGAGSAILSIAAALLGARPVVALERDPHACATARRNVQESGVTDAVEVRRVEVTPGNFGRIGRFDGVVANLQADLLLPLLPAFRSALTPTGWLIVSGVIRPEVEAVSRAIRRAGLERVGQATDDGWWTGWFYPGGSPSLSGSSASPGPSPIVSRTRSSTSAHTSAM